MPAQDHGHGGHGFGLAFVYLIQGDFVDLPGMGVFQAQGFVRNVSVNGTGHNPVLPVGHPGGDAARAPYGREGFGHVMAARLLQNQLNDDGVLGHVLIAGLIVLAGAEQPEDEQADHGQDQHKGDEYFHPQAVEVHHIAPTNKYPVPQMVRIRLLCSG